MFPPLDRLAPRTEPGWFEMDTNSTVRNRHHRDYETLYAAGGFTYDGGLAQPVIDRQVLDFIMEELDQEDQIETRRLGPRDRYGWEATFYDELGPVTTEKVTPRPDGLFTFEEWAIFTPVEQPRPTMQVRHPNLPFLALDAYSINAHGIPTVPPSSVTTWLQAIAHPNTERPWQTPQWIGQDFRADHPAPEFFAYPDNEFSDAHVERDAHGQYQLRDWGEFNLVPPSRSVLPARNVGRAATPVRRAR